MQSTSLRDPELRALRATQMISLRIRGTHTLADIAQEFNVTTQTVERELAWAKRQGLVRKFEDQILEDLVPEAITAVKDALANGDTQTALEVLKGTGMLKKQTDRPSLPDGDLTLEKYTLRIVGGTTDSSSSSPAGLREAVLDGAVIDSPALPPAVGADGRVSAATPAEVALSERAD